MGFCNVLVHFREHQKWPKFGKQSLLLVNFIKFIKNDIFLNKSIVRENIASVGLTNNIIWWLLKFT